MFLDRTWQALETALKSEDNDLAREAFLLERTACMSCHVAEEHAFINDMPIFKETESFPHE
jgi:hypothetical protein